MPIWPFRRKVTKADVTPSATQPSEQVLSLLSPDEVHSLGGLPVEGIAGRFESESMSVATFRQNPAFVEFMHQVIRTAGPKRSRAPGCRAGTARGVGVHHRPADAGGTQRARATGRYYRSLRGAGRSDHGGLVPTEFEARRLHGGWPGPSPSVPPACASRTVAESFLIQKRGLTGATPDGAVECSAQLSRTAPGH